MPFKKGQSGNPKGMTPGTLSLVWKLKRKLDEIPPGCDNSYADQLVDAYVRKAISGKDSALLSKDAFDRVDGKPKSSEGDLGSEENPINHNIRYIIVPAKKGENM